MKFRRMTKMSKEHFRGNGALFQKGSGGKSRFFYGIPTKKV